MGWSTANGLTKAELIAYLTETTSFLRTHRKCIRGNILWTVQENVEHPELGCFIVAYVLERDPAFGWAYKSVEESAGPVSLSCPLSYLDAAPMPDNPFARRWRERIRLRHRTIEALSRYP